MLKIIMCQKKNQITWLITENVSRKAVFMNAGIDYMSKIK